MFCWMMPAILAVFNQLFLVSCFVLSHNLPCHNKTHFLTKLIVATVAKIEEIG